MGSNQIDIGILLEDEKYCVSPAYSTYKIKNCNSKFLEYYLNLINPKIFEGKQHFTGISGFFSAYGSEFKNKERLKKGDNRIYAYLRGEEIEARTADGGFCAVIYEGAAIGGGKASGGRIKNHYPKGLRTR